MGLAKRWMAAVALLVIVGLVAAGCAWIGDPDIDAEGLRKEAGRSAFVPTAGEASARAYARIGSLSGSLGESNGLLPIRWATGASGGVTITVRPFGDVERAVTNEQLEALRETIFAQAGGMFPLEIDVLACCGQAPDVRGIVSAVDPETGAIEVAGTAFGDADAVVWVVPTADALIVGGETGRVLDWTDIGIGRNVEAWWSGQAAGSADRMSVRKLVAGGL